MAIFFAIVGSQVVYSKQTAPLMIGFVLGLSAMMAQLFFVLTCWFLALGVQAGENGYDTESADKAMGAFCFFNMIIYAVFAIILAVHRGTINTTSRTTTLRYKNSSDYDPTINEDYGEEEQV